MLTAAGFQLKGSGWYVTDFRGGHTSAGGETKTTTISVGAYKPFQKVTIFDDNVIEVVNVTDSEGNIWYEVDNLAQDAIFDTLQNTNPNDPNFSGNTAI